VGSLGIEEVLIAPQGPRQNPFAESVIGSIRRECLDHVIVLSERHLRTIMSDMLDGTGDLSCNSCHDAHNEYGNSSLLRITKSGSQICAWSATTYESLRGYD
jgi:hypothetical protein